MIFYDDLLNKLKPKTKEAITQKNYAEQLILSLITMFEYDGLPDSIPSVFIEKYLITNGQIGFSDKHGNLVAFTCTDGVSINEYGLGTRLIGATAINSYDCEIGTECVWGWNNSLICPDIDINRVSHLLEEIATSLEFNLRWSRLNPIPVAKNKSVKTAIQTALEKIFQGELVSVMSDNVLSEINGQKGIETINLTDVSTVDKIQYLCRLFDDIYKQWYTRYGLAITTVNQGSQTLKDELHGWDDVSFIEPLDRLNCRKKMIDDLNELYGEKYNFHASVKFSEPWERAYERWKREDQNADQSADQNADQNADQSADQTADQSDGGDFDD